jgi:hypothetical protein
MVPDSRTIRHFLPLRFVTEPKDPDFTVRGSSHREDVDHDGVKSECGRGWRFHAMRVVWCTEDGRMTWRRLQKVSTAPANVVEIAQEGVGP